MNHTENSSDQNQPRKSGAVHSAKIAAMCGVLLLLAGVAFGMFQRSAQSRTLTSETEQQAAMPVHDLLAAPMAKRKRFRCRETPRPSATHRSMRAPTDILSAGTWTSAHK